MPLFSKDEIETIDALARGKSLKKLGEAASSQEAFDDRLDGIKAKLGGCSANEIPERFKNLTGWSGKPSDYPQ